MSEVKVNKVSPRSGTTVTIGDSGDTINLVGTLQNNGSPLTGDISSVVAGTGLSGGATSGVATLNIEAAQPTITSLGTITGLTVTGTGVVTNLKSTNNNTVLRLRGSNATNGGALGSTSSDELTFLSGLSERMRLNGTGLGIGTTSPSQPLTVSSSSTNVPLKLITTGSQTYSGIMFESTQSDDYVGIGVDVENLKLRTDDGHITFCVAENSEKMRLSSAGNLGIGTSSPSAKLELASSNSGGTANALMFTDTDTGTTANQKFGAIQFNSSDSGNTGIGGAIDAISEDFDGNTAIRILTGAPGSASERMRITSGGFVGIGTTAPGSPLTVSGGTNSTVAFLNNTVSTTTSSSTMLLLQNNTSGSAGVGHGISIGFNAERNDGNNQRYGTLTWVANTNSGTSLKTDFVVTSYSGHEVLRLKQTSVGSQNEMIAPDLLTTGSTSNRYPLYWVHNGTVGSIQPYTGSVREMKTDINDMSSVDWIHSLKPRSFKFRDFETNEDGSKVYLETTNDLPNTEYGLIAEEVNQVNGSDYILDKQIDEDGTENLKGVLYHNLVPVLLKAVQEQKNTIQELEARITTLENV